MTGSGGPRWLDGLARRAARGEVAERPRLSRRTVLQTAGAAALLAGPLRLLQPGVARAVGTDCEVALKEQAFSDYKTCVLPPLADLAKFKQAAQLVTDALPKAKTAKKRKALRAILAKAKAGINTTNHKIEACDAKYVKDRLQAEVTCEQAGGGGGGGGGGGPLPLEPLRPGHDPVQLQLAGRLLLRRRFLLPVREHDALLHLLGLPLLPLDTPWG